MCERGTIRREIDRLRHRHIDLDAVSSSTLNAIERLTTQVNGSLESLDANFINRYNENVHDSKALY